MRAARRKRAHEDPGGVDRVHPQPVSEQRPAGAPVAGVDREHADAALRMLASVAADQLVEQARLPGASGSGEADHRSERRASHPLQPLTRVAQCGGLAAHALLEPADRAGHRSGTLERDRLLARRARLGPRKASFSDLPDHSVQSQSLTVLGAEDPRHSVTVQRIDLFG